MNANRVSFALIVIPLLASARSEAQQSWLHGYTLDMHGAVIPGIQIRVASREHECMSTTDIEGRFNWQLPPGAYEVTALGNNIVPYRRSTVTVASAHPTSLIVRPLFAAPSDQDRIPNPAPKYQVVNAKSGALMRFETSQGDSDSVTFRGDLMLSVEAVSIYADSITCSTQRSTCSARGSVLVDAGSEQLQGTSIEVDLSNRTFVLRREPAVTRTF